MPRRGQAVRPARVLIGVPAGSMWWPCCSSSGRAWRSALAMVAGGAVDRTSRSGDDSLWPARLAGAAEGQLMVAVKVPPFWKETLPPLQMFGTLMEPW
jgi:hypothetical protein